MSKLCGITRHSVFPDCSPSRSSFIWIDHIDNVEQFPDDWTRWCRYWFNDDVVVDEKPDGRSERPILWIFHFKMISLWSNKREIMENEILLRWVRARRCKRFWSLTSTERRSVVNHENWSKEPFWRSSQRLFNTQMGWKQRPHRERRVNTYFQSIQAKFQISITVTSVPLSIATTPPTEVNQNCSYFENSCLSYAQISINATGIPHESEAEQVVTTTSTTSTTTTSKVTTTETATTQATPISTSPFPTLIPQGTAETAPKKVRRY